MRLDLKHRWALGILKHQAAVWPAIRRDRKNMPENAVEEWPEGNDLRPLAIVASSLIRSFELDEDDCTYGWEHTLYTFEWPYPIGIWIENLVEADLYNGGWTITHDIKYSQLVYRLYWMLTNAVLQYLGDKFSKSSNKKI